METRMRAGAQDKDPPEQAEIEVLLHPCIPPSRIRVLVAATCSTFVHLEKEGEGDPPTGQFG